MDRALISGVGLSAWLCLANCAYGAEFFDPTRPVTATAQSAPVAEGRTQVGVAMVVTAKEGVIALVDGQVVRVGSRMDDGVVSRITSDALFVRSAKGLERRIPLYPEVRVTPAGSAASTARSAKK